MQFLTSHALSLPFAAHVPGAQTPLFGQGLRAWASLTAKIMETITASMASVFDMLYSSPFRDLHFEDSVIRTCAPQC